MASVKQYAYYMEGSKIALVEKEASFDNDPNSKDYGPGTDKFQWKSPLVDVSEGLELLYSYSPIYKIWTAPTVDVNKFYINGWTVIDGYLTFLRHNYNQAHVDWTSSPESTVTSLSAGDTGGQSLDYILVGGSSRWNGIHQVKTAGTEGTLQTWTRVSNVNMPHWRDIQVDFTIAEIIDGGDSTVYLADYFSAGDYIWISGCDSPTNNGLFSVSSVSQSHGAGSSTVTVGNSYNAVKSSDSVSASTGLDNEYIGTPAFTNDTDESDINIHKAERDFAYVISNVNVLNDEADIIDLPEYLSKAAVDYVKAKYLEDGGQFKEAEYFMVKFRKQVEKYNNRLVSGARMISSGPYGIR